MYITAAKVSLMNHIITITSDLILVFDIQMADLTGGISGGGYSRENQELQLFFSNP